MADDAQGSFQSRLIAWAFRESKAGIRESGGPNAGAPFDRYALPGEQPLAWCARFVRAGVKACNGAIPGNEYEWARVANAEKMMADKGWLVTSPRPGDAVFFHSRTGSDKGPGRHMGIVTGVGSHTFRTVEGNRGDKVGEGEYQLGSPLVSSFGRWP